MFQFPLKSRRFIRLTHSIDNATQTCRMACGIPTRGIHFRIISRPSVEPGHERSSIGKLQMRKLRRSGGHLVLVTVVAFVRFCQGLSKVGFRDSFPAAKDRQLRGALRGVDHIGSRHAIHLRGKGLDGKLRLHPDG